MIGNPISCVLFTVSMATFTVYGFVLFIGILPSAVVSSEDAEWVQTTAEAVEPPCDLTEVCLNKIDQFQNDPECWRMYEGIKCLRKLNVTCPHLFLPASYEHDVPFPDLLDVVQVQYNDECQEDEEKSSHNDSPSTETISSGKIVLQALTLSALLLLAI